MPRRSSNTFSLVRKRIRPSFNKANVYNAATWEKNANRNTQYRQVFFAKQETRSYHGEHLTETQFRNVFKPENSSVSPLQSQRRNQDGEVPYAMQTFTALERRLDFAVFRSLFSSSVRQAAQFIVGGAVKVNGVKISSPSYQLQAGDVFSVDPNRVLEALGRTKPSIKDSVELTNRIIRKYNRHLDRCRSNPEKMFALREKFRQRHQVHSAKHTVAKQRRVDAHNAALKMEMNNQFMQLGPKPVLSSILSGDFKSASDLVKGKVNQVVNLVKGDQYDSKSPPQTTSEQEVDADKSSVDPLKGKPRRADPQTTSEQEVDADNSSFDPLKGRPNHADPQTTSEQEVVADNSPVDPLKGRPNHSHPKTASEQEVVADNSPVDPLKGRPNHSHPKTASEEEVVADISPVDPLKGRPNHSHPKTTSEEEVIADISPVDPLKGNKKAYPQTNAEQDLDADKSAMDPLAGKPHRPDPQTISEQEVDADNSTIDPLKGKAHRADPQTISEQDIDADKSPIDPLNGKNRPDPETISEQDLDADKDPRDPLTNTQKHLNPETTSEQDVGADKSPIDPLPEYKKASHLHHGEPHRENTASEDIVDAENTEEDPLKKTQAGAFSAKEAESIAAKYTDSESRPPSIKNVLRLVDEIIKETRLEIREKFHSRMIDIDAPAPYDPTWVERLPEKFQEVAADMAEEDLANLKIALPWSTTGKLYGLADPSKRWFTPWTPRQFIAPMAVLPHHIEVDFETCHAVYLRDPVARPNHSEVVSPFSLEMHERAHMWYFYRRRKNLSRM